MSLMPLHIRPPVIDFGCGTDKEPGAFGVDNVRLPGVDLVYDLLDFPYPFPDGSAKEIYLKHVLEHFELSDLQRILAEAYRILAPGGIVHVHVPHVFSVAGWADPTHRMGFTFVSGVFFTRNAAKAYYKETENRWDLASTRAGVLWFDWKRYRLRKLDNLLGKMLAGGLNWLLRRPNWPSGADLLVKILPVFFVEIRWQFQKPIP